MKTFKICLERFLILSQHLDKNLFYIGTFHSRKMSSAKINYPAANRNKTPILEVLKKHFDANLKGTVLELASGTGQHVSFFATNFPNLEFQPSETEQSLFESIKAYANDTPTKNVRHPVRIDTSAKDVKDWKLNEYFDYIICVNMIHVSPIECSIGLFKNGSQVLKPGGLIVTYGAYAYKGVIEPQSNIDFDRSIRSQHPDWGLRDIVDLENIANEHGIVLVHKYDLPANNKCLIWKKQR
ncbi:hypothetical protein WA026_009941 [Henosepilachna vigintioctopunctata]|uniref:Methyltransferase-like 26 n=1 Tax=Henosepilachna vigintioctopunctata TaxID=420089 RepID=A0AAW1TS62_9CUCU